MLTSLHKNARTTLATRADIAASSEPASVLARRYGITEQTVYKWKKREVFHDRSHTAHRLQTILNPAQEMIVVHLRQTLMLSLDDLLTVAQEFLCPQVSRSGLDRCLRRHGKEKLGHPNAKPPSSTRQGSRRHKPGHVHIDVKQISQMEGRTSRRYLFVAIDRSTRWVFVQLKANKTTASAQAFLKALHGTCPIRITKLLTDNDKEFTERVFANKDPQIPNVKNEFDQLCQELGIEHHQTNTKAPRANAPLKHSTACVADVLKTRRFKAHEDLEQTLLRYVTLYNHKLPQSALKNKTPIQCMKDWHQTHPNLFHRKPYERLRCDR
ncbi:DDE-type integrase/transposase/recombinase [Delftia sp. RIT313]|uniref:DDE-type integrase/transposase/recombinase n=1 Tax=Delftia sp. RIT313 TaxID=1468410 RepID=UPI0005C204D8|nr:DDE-type integrase/transposase/recombinase [Delftia sp. RIT313]